MEKEQWLLNNVLAKIVHEKQIDILILPNFCLAFRAKLLHCKLKSVVARITTACSTFRATNFSVAS